ncbi:MAG: multidrug ABC transporter permease [Bdellovibrionales bacterium RIFOXYC1_FULL_54_43]|nr:MAG: multidrug ABC transporter permease [Bdellovibrionales bacterium RIFOXYC1_FULL_54_43]OFZ84356.1 MAG: multidrug ABC transporter permease [Bdellovibrionales bacterium RIFOXYD1_FULL_55_31]
MNRTLLGFIRKELTQTLRDKRMRVLLFVVPVIQLTLFGVALSNEVKNIRLVSVFPPGDAVMQKIHDRSIASGWFLPVSTQKVFSDPFELIRSGTADAVLVAPPGGLTRALGRGDAKLQLLLNAMNVIEAQAMESYVSAIVQRTILEDLRLDPPEPSIQVNSRVLFNPGLETAIFMVPATLAMVMIITTMVMTNNAIVREKEMGTFEMLISAPVSPAEVIYGKTIPYVILGMSNFPLILGVAVFVFGVPMRGSLLVLVLAAFAFVCTAVALGTLISTFCKNQQQATLAAFLFLFPMIMFGGLFFPIENMPVSIRWVAYLDPLYHYIGLLRNIMLKGGGHAYVGTHILALGLMALVSVVWSFRRFRTTL